MDPAKKILVVDDEPELLRAVGRILDSRGYEVESVTTGEEAIEFVASETADAIILDLELPGVSGLEVCRVVREYSSVPILVLSVRDGEADKIAALDLGADDYITKPFSAGELLARVRAMLRRVPSDAGPDSLFTAGDLEVDTEARVARRGGEQVALTRIEFDILATLLKNVDRVVTTRALAKAIWGELGEANVKALRVHMSHLRAKIEDRDAETKCIHTEPGVGYRLSSY